MEKVILISGAGSGIGRAIALELAQTNPNVRLLLLGRNEASLAETRHLLSNSEQHLVAVADVREAESIRSALQRAKLTKLDGVIANAGIGGENHYGPEDRWNDIIATNLSGTYYLVNEAMPLLKATSQKFRHIIVVSSILGRIGVPNYSAYCAAKTGLLGLVRSWAASFAADKILVNAICPGWIDTSMAKAGIEAMASANGKSLDATLAEQMSYVPLKKMGQPSEVAALVGFLLSSNQQSITGQSLDINNGAWMA